MTVPQDVGGRPAFGPVIPEDDEPPFHADWEKRALGLVLGAGAWGAWSIDESRSARELVPAPVYFASSYYEVWTMGLETLAKRHGFLSDRDLATGHAVDPATTPRRVLKAADIAAMLARGGPSNRPLSTPARFGSGDCVRTSTIDPPHHTRLPHYARGKIGVVETVHEPHVFPDSNAQRLGEAPQWLYTVAFDARKLFGPSADPTLTVSIDAWESYLEPA
ncbi:MAG TPA: nitrile hydratase subunit beta [Hyphomonadaceae bacterium]|nr:nitrile hydratase subunit beta [Hyphomonadaceae bacterium]